MNEEKPKALFSSLLAPMAAGAYYRRTGYAYLGLGAFFALTALVLGALSIVDKIGVWIVCIFAVLACLPGFVRLRRAARAHVGDVVHQTLETVPRAMQEPIIKRQIVLSAIVFPLGSLWMADSFLKLENGEVARVHVWAPIGLIYTTMGFWPAVLALPCFGAFAVFALVKKLRKLQEPGR